MRVIRLKELIKDLPDDTQVVTIDHLGIEDEPFLLHTKDNAIIIMARKVAELYIRENPEDLINVSL